MLEREPSRTALAAAAHRAVHQVLERGRIFADPLATVILGDATPGFVRDAQARPETRGMRAFIAARSRVAEAALAQGVETRDVRQLVVLGAGLDTFAYRNPLADRLQVFEVDHPATQTWKRRRLAETGITIPASLAYAPVDFEREGLADALAAAGWRATERTFFTWLGVVPYLTRDAIGATLSLIGALPGGGEVVFDYSDPPERLSRGARARWKDRAARVASLGEPFLSTFDPDELHDLLRRSGLSRIDDLGPRPLVERYILPADAPAIALAAARLAPNRGGHVIFAATD